MGHSLRQMKLGSWQVWTCSAPGPWKTYLNDGMLEGLLMVPLGPDAKPLCTYFFPPTRISPQWSTILDLTSIIKWTTPNIKLSEFLLFTHHYLFQLSPNMFRFSLSKHTSTHTHTQTAFLLATELSLLFSSQPDLLNSFHLQFTLPIYSFLH